MTINSIAPYLTSPALAVSSGLLSCGSAYFIRGIKHKNWEPHFFQTIVAFVGGTAFPAAVALVMYSYFEKPPDLNAVVIYIPIAGLSLLYTSYATFKQAIKNDS